MFPGLQGEGVVDSNRLDTANELQQRVAAVHRIFEEHGEFVRSLISFFLSDKDIIDDFYQDLYLYLIANPLEFSEEEGAKGLLYRIIQCRSKNWLRKKRQDISRIQRYAEIQNEQDAHNSGGTIADHYDMERVYRLIEKYLSPQESQAVLLRYRDRYDLKETAAIMGVKANSAKRYVSVGLKKVRELFQDNKEIKP